MQEHDEENELRTNRPVFIKKRRNSKANERKMLILILLNMLILTSVGILYFKQTGVKTCELSSASMESILKEYAPVRTLSAKPEPTTTTSSTTVTPIQIEQSPSSPVISRTCVSGPLPISESQLDKLVYNRKQHFDSNKYWEERYKGGADSGAGSYGEQRAWKAGHINKYVKDNNIQTVLEYGFGDGSQLSAAEYPQYTGVDVSRTVLAATSEKFKDDPTKRFFHTSDPIVPFLSAEMTMSLDVLFHLIDRPLFVDYVNRLFSHSRKHVAVYSCNEDNDHASHVLFRDFTSYVSAAFPEFQLVFQEKSPVSDNGCAGIFFFQKS